MANVFLFPSNVFKSINLISHDPVDLTHGMAGSSGILKYFNLTPVASSTSPTLPDPDGPLSEKVPAKAIELANAELEQQSKETPRGRRLPYTILTPAQRYEVGKRASEHGVTASLRYFSKKYP